MNGDDGLPGSPGPAGVPGDRGVEGEQGDRGDTGEIFEVIHHVKLIWNYPAVAVMHSFRTENPQKYELIFCIFLEKSLNKHQKSNNEI